MSRIGKNPVAIPQGVDVQIASGVLTAKGKLGTLKMNLSNEVTTTVENQLPVLTGEINSRLDEESKILTPNPSLDTLGTLESGWRKIGDSLGGWMRDLKTRGLLDKPVEIVLPTHGPPTDRAALERALT